jgi:peptidoglycan-N-acetylglucosamine deacetylase
VTRGYIPTRGSGGSGPWILALILFATWGCSVSPPPTSQSTSTSPYAPPTSQASSTTRAVPTTAGTTSTSTTVVVTTTETPTTTTRPETTTLPDATAPSLLITRGPAAQRVIALTFDAGSDRGYAEGILDVLASGGIRATFGMTGRWAEANPDLLARMKAEGHALMNHTYDHPHMETLSRADRLDQLERTDAIITGLIGVSTKPYFRPPYGAYNNQVLADVGSAGYRYAVMWTVDSLGWKGLPVADVVDRCLTMAEPGAILLLHVGAASTDYEALPSILAGLEESGYQFVTIPELIP